MKAILASALVVLCITIALPQNTTRLSGKVESHKTGEPIPFAYVKLTDLAIGTVTQADGKFTMLIPNRYLNRQLQISYVGYKTFKISLKEALANKSLVVKLEEDVTLLSEVVITPRKEENPKTLLKKSLKAIDDNYKADTFGLKGYYRETVQENGAYIMFADAAVKYKLRPYQKANYKWKEYERSFINLTKTLSSFSYQGGVRLHRYHFHNRTLKGEKAGIIDARASDNLSKTRLTASIEGGPMGIFGKDRVKFQKYFLDNFGDYDYTLAERYTDDNRWEYVVMFKPNLSQKKIDRWKKNNRLWGRSYMLLSGEIYIDEETMAITGYEYSVPPEFKQYICGFKGWNIRHFDYKVEASYKPDNGKYYLDYIRQEDEFIIHDTTQNVITPYAAVTVWQASEVIDPPSITEEELFRNTDANRLFDFPLEYNKEFWQAYEAENPQAIIGSEIRSDMEEGRPVEVQFASKNIRDTTLAPPVAEKIPTKHTLHGETWVDNYAWMKDVRSPKTNEKVMNYLEAENKYTDNFFAPLRRDQRNLYAQMTAVVDKDYVSLPIRKDDYLYHYEYNGEDEHPTFYRKKRSGDEKELLLDVNAMAANKPFFTAGSITPSPTHRLFAYYENNDGSDKYVVKFKDTQTGEILNDSLYNVNNITWINDNTLLYIKPEKKTLRSNRVYLHTLRSPQTNDRLIFEEKDPRYSIGMNKTESDEFILLSSYTKTTTELNFYRVSQKDVKFNLVHEREEGLKYGVKHYKDKFYVATNDKAENYKIMVTDTAKYQKKYWQKFIPHNKDVLIRDFEIFDKYFVVQEKRQANNYLRVIENATGKSHDIEFDEELGYPRFTSNPYFDTDSLRLYYASFKTVPTYYDYHMGTRKRTLLKKTNRTNMMGSKYLKVERVYATARDGKQIPITLLYYKWTIKSKVNPKRLYITSYGSYGSGMDAFHSNSLSPLLSRGFVYAIAHVRGGDDMGMQWYDDGKLLNKKNTFTDFIDCTEYLIKEGYADKDQVVAEGGSAGGLLMGAVANMRPDLYSLLVLNVPFVDVVNTMLDDQLSLTTGEYEEWGNPNEKKYFKYMKSYSPYDNVKAQAYPNMIFITGLNDTRVGYWEPAKMVAKLRAHNTADTEILLKTDFNSGHGGGSGRFEYYRDTSYKYALIFDFLKAQKEENPNTSP